MPAKKRSPFEDRLKAFRRGWGHPTQKEAERLNRLINVKLAKKTESPKSAKTLEALLFSQQQLSRQQGYERLRLQSRIATKYALDARGLSPIHDAAKRKKVHIIIEKYLPTILIDGLKKTKLVQTQFNRELEKTLDYAQEPLFTEDFFKKLKILIKAQISLEKEASEF